MEHRSAQGCGFPYVDSHFAGGEHGQAEADVGRHHAAPALARHLRATEEARRAGAEFCYLETPTS